MAGPDGIDVIEANNKFSVELHKALKNDHQFTGQNLFYSPTSLSIALAMTSMGARGNTAAQMNKVLHWEGLSQDQLHTEQRQFQKALHKSNAAGNELLAANRLFLQKNFNVLQEFVEGTKQFYDAEIALVDYKNDVEGARKEVNEWVEKKTKKKIKDLIQGGAFSTLTRLILVNAIYFKGFWDSPFKKTATSPQEFFVSEREKVEVQMMHVRAEFKDERYVEGLGCQVLELPYRGKDLSMVILLPHNIDGLATLEEGLTHDKLHKAIQSVAKLHTRTVEVSLPKFKLAQQFFLDGILEKMGATDMFYDDKADFTGIAPGLFVSDVIHKAFVEVNEEGTEAAAATGVPVLTRSITPSFCVNHPFLFLICHNKSNAILFMGRVIKPE